MINIILGAPGGGKSYEAVVFHILPALAKGRKVITNLPLVLEEFASIDPSYSDLIQLRHDMVEVTETKKNFFGKEETTTSKKRPFATMDFFADPWRHPETGSGALYVIDECHMCLPRGGTDKAVEEWFSMHRHESADVLLIAQSYGKVSKDICDMLQMVYRVRKNVAFGSSKTYVRKVQDGLRGEVVNTTIREYKAKFFNLYKSHTKGGGSELAATDIVPLWKHWSFIGAAVCLVLIVGILAFSNVKIDPSKAGIKNVQANNAVPNPAHNIPSSVSPPAVGGAVIPAGFEVYTPGQEKGIKDHHPLEKLELHITAFMSSERIKAFYLFMASQNGQPAFSMSQKEIEKAGYTITPVSDCIAKVTYKSLDMFVTCDMPRQGLAGSVQSAAPLPSI